MTGINPSCVVCWQSRRSCDMLAVQDCIYTKYIHNTYQDGVILDVICRGSSLCVACLMNKVVAAWRYYKF
jgi:hypothetical protein